MEKLDWLKDVPQNELLSVLDGDALYIAESCGLNTLFSLWEGGTIKQTLSITEKSFLSAKRIYIKKYFDGTNVKQLARELQVSVKFVYDVLGEKHRKILNS